MKISAMSEPFLDFCDTASGRIYYQTHVISETAPGFPDSRMEAYIRVLKQQGYNIKSYTRKLSA